MAGMNDQTGSNTYVLWRWSACEGELKEELGMGQVYKKASLENLELLADTRVQVLRAANGLGDDADLSEVHRESLSYYKDAMGDKSHVAYLVFDNDMYPHPEYRRKGIAIHTLDLLVREARAAGITHITLEATAMGRPLYERYGFVKMQDEMELPL